MDRWIGSAVLVRKGGMTASPTSMEGGGKSGLGLGEGGRDGKGDMAAGERRVGEGLDCGVCLGCGCRRPNISVLK